MDAAASWARHRGLAGVRLESEPGNVVASNFYGFELIGRDRLLSDALSDTGETALFWHLRFATAKPEQGSERVLRAPDNSHIDRA
jgi:stress-induced morphogen